MSATNGLVFDPSLQDFHVINLPEAETIYDKCFTLVNKYMNGHRLCDSFNDWGIDSPAALKEKYSEKQITKIFNILQWYCILHYGYLMPSSDFPKTLEFLGVSSTLEIFNPKNDIFARFDKLFVKTDEPHFRMMLRILEAYIKVCISPVAILDIFDDVACFDYSKILAIFYDPIEALSPEERFCLKLFLSVSIRFIDHYDGNMESLWKWKFGLSHNMMLLLPKIESYMNVIQNKSISARPTFDPPAQFRFAKPPIAALPNCIPHAANSCYMAAAITPLAFVLDAEIGQAISTLSFREQASCEVKACQEAFCAFYANVRSAEVVDITIPQVDNLRANMQKAYDYRFFNAQARVQEDAGDFLMCILEDVLQMVPDAHFLKKRTFQPLDVREQIESERYNYAAALSTKYEELKENMTDISLKYAGEDIEFGDLATGVCQTNDMDLNAYRKDEKDTSGPKYRTIMVHHQEQLVVESKDKAPSFFCARLTRFSQDPKTSVKLKHHTPVAPSLVLQFRIQGEEESDNRVNYCLHAITVHSGANADGGHYYCYLLHEDKIYKYDDLAAPELCTNQTKVWQDVLTNGYVFYYRKA